MKEYIERYYTGNNGLNASRRSISSRHSVGSNGSEASATDGFWSLDEGVTSRLHGAAGDDTRVNVDNESTITFASNEIRVRQATAQREPAEFNDGDRTETRRSNTNNNTNNDDAIDAPIKGTERTAMGQAGPTKANHPGNGHPVDSDHQSMKQQQQRHPHDALPPSHARKERSSENDSESEYENESNGTSSPSDELCEGSLRDLSVDKQRVGESSQVFIKSIYGAAQKRKRQMARSRDSLIAKEVKHRLSLEGMANENNENNDRVDENESRTDSRNLKGSYNGTLSPISVSTTSTATTVMASNNHHHHNNNQFKARPLPRTSSKLGGAGLVGVPKVDSRPTTTPFSPLLGKRRPQKVKVKALKRPPNQSKHSLDNVHGKRKTVSTTTDITTNNTNVTTAKTNAHAHVNVKTQTKTTKISRKAQACSSRRRSTPAMSASALAASRQGNNKARPAKDRKSIHFGLSQKERTNVSVGRTRRISEVATPSPRRHHQSIESPMLLGLRLVKTPQVRTKIPTSIEEKENSFISPTNSTIKPFEPKSTIRARQRAKFDTQRRRSSIQRHEHDMEEMKQRISQLKIELKTMHQGL